MTVLDNEGFDRRISLRECLLDWTDVDVAAYHLGRQLGVLPPPQKDETEGDHFRRCKSIFWSANPLGDALYEALKAMEKCGFLERLADEHGIHGACPWRFVLKPPVENSFQPGADP